MATKVFFINSNQARYTDEEVSAIQTYLLEAGVLNKEAGNDDLAVIQDTPASMDVLVEPGGILISYLKDGITWKVFAISAAQETLTIAANSSGINRVDAIVMSLSQDDPNALKNNVATVEVVLGDGATALSDADIDTALGHTNWSRLADVTVANGATTIVTANIADTRTAVGIGINVGGYKTRFIGDGSALDGVVHDLVDGHVLPDADDTWDLGSALFQFGDVYGARFHGDGSGLTGLVLENAENIGDTLTAGHALLAGMAVAIESDGNLYMLRPLSAGAFGTDTNINTSQNYQYALKTQAVDISATKKLLIFVDSSGVANIQLREVTVNPATGAYVSSTSDSAAGAGSTDNFDFKMIDATNGILVYTYSGTAYARIISDVGNGVTVGAAQNLGAASNSQVAVEVISATEAVLIRVTSGTGLVSLQLTISGATVTVGTTSTFLSTANNLTIYSVHEIDTNKHLICYQNSTNALAYFMVATYDTGTHAYTSIGTPVSLGEDATHLPSWNVFIINTTTALIGYATSNTGSVRVRTVSVSGNVPTVNAATTMANALYNGHVTLSKVGPYHFLVFYTSGSGATYGYRGQLVELDVDGYDALTAVGSAIGTGTGSDTGLFGVVVNADYMLMLYAQVSATDDELNQWALTHNFDGFVGLTNAAAAASASVIFTNLGKVTPGNAVVAGSLYTAKHSGQISTDPTTYGYPIVGVGRADGDIQVSQRAAA